MRIIRNFGFLLLIIIIFQVLAKDSYACMCGATSVCEANTNADAVVLAKVKSFKSVKVPLDIIFADGKKSDVLEDGQEVFLEVSKTYKGKEFTEINLLQPNSNCDWIFSADNLEKEYLFYLDYSKKYKRYRVAMCSRSSSIETASDDLSWLNGLPESLKRNRISGVSQLKDTENLFPPISKINLQIKGEKESYSVTTNKKGLYEVWDLPIGKYSVIPEIPSKYQLAWTKSTPENWTYFWNPDKDLKALQVTINKNSCGGVDFMFENKKDEK